MKGTFCRQEEKACTAWNQPGSGSMFKTTLPCWTLECENIETECGRDKFRYSPRNESRSRHLAVQSTRWNSLTRSKWLCKSWWLWKECLTPHSTVITTTWLEETPPRGGVSLLGGFQTQNLEEEELGCFRKELIFHFFKNKNLLRTHLIWSFLFCLPIHWWWKWLELKYWIATTTQFVPNSN